MTRYFTVFVNEPHGRVPGLLERREVDGDSTTDAYYREGQWHSRPYSELDRYLSYGGGLPYDEITEAQAFELIGMIDARHRRPFST